MSPKGQTVSGATTWPTICRPGPSECSCWPTTSVAARLPPPPTFSRRPEHGATVRRCWSAASGTLRARHPARRRAASTTPARRHHPPKPPPKAIVVLDDREKMIDFASAYAPEHLIVSMRDMAEPRRRSPIPAASSSGRLITRSAGDYASGTNHTLPTGGWARAYSGATPTLSCARSLQELTTTDFPALSPDDHRHGSPKPKGSGRTPPQSSSEKQRP